MVGRGPPMGPDSKMRNLVLTASVSRKAGGLFESVRRLSQSLNLDQSVDVEVLSLEDDFTKQDIGAWTPLAPQAFPVVLSRQYGYAPGLGNALKGSDADIIHNHGLWMYPSTAVSLWARKKGCPYVVSPHGMLDSWAVRNAWWKKKIAGWIYENHHLDGAACIRALCESEALSIRQYGLKNPICVIPNGIDLRRCCPAGSPSWKDKGFEDKKILLYLGRLHLKKGLLNLL